MGKMPHAGAMLSGAAEVQLLASFYGPDLGHWFQAKPALLLAPVGRGVALGASCVDCLEPRQRVLPVFGQGRLNARALQGVPDKKGKGGDFAATEGTRSRNPGRALPCSAPFPDPDPG